MRRKLGTTGILLLGLIGLSSGCEQAPEGWTPVLEETSTTFLQTEAERLMEHVRNAREQLESDPDGTEEELRAAESTLEHLLDYYIPLLEARERAYNAYRSFYLGDEERMGRELRRIEEILTSMAEHAEGGRLQEIESLAETLADTRMDTAAGPGEGRAALEELARALNEAAVKGDLILTR